MALSPCRECGQQVSSEAPACPHCGVPDPSEAAAAQAQEDRLQKRRAEEKSVDNTQKGCLGCLGAVILVAFAFMMCPADTAVRSTASSRPAPTASQLEARLAGLGAGDAILRVTSEGTLAWVTVADAWYVLPCFQRQRVAKGIRSQWRSLGGSNIVVQDVAGTQIADFRILSDDFDIRGCD